MKILIYFNWTRKITRYVEMTTNKSFTAYALIKSNMNTYLKFYLNLLRRNKLIYISLVPKISTFDGVYYILYLIYKQRIGNYILYLYYFISSFTQVNKFDFTQIIYT